MDKGLENIASAAADWLLTEGMLAEREQSLGLRAQTPIENYFFRALMLCEALRVSWFETVNGTAPEHDQQIALAPQHRVLDWPVDYLITVISEAGVISRLVVECDGHDYHERTKEQAARDRGRDRALSEAGYTIFRFTGSELYRDAFGCARQVLRWAEKAAFRKAE